MVERRDLPLFAWGETLRAARRRRRNLQRRTSVVALGCACVVATIVAPPLPRLVWNASASAPVGLYWVRPGARIVTGNTVIAWTPAPVRRLAAERRYVPLNVPLVKRVAGVEGDRICAIGATILVNHRKVATRRVSDGQGRPMPWWSGCWTLGEGEYFLLMPDVADSFDGRYFGVAEQADVIGRAQLLWAR